MLQQNLADRDALLDAHFAEYFSPLAGTHPDVRRGDYAEALAALNHNADVLRGLLRSQP